MNFALGLAANRLPGITTSWSPRADDSAGTMLATDDLSAESEESRLESLLVAGGISDSTRSAVLQQFQQQSAQMQGASAQPVSTQGRHSPPAQAAPLPPHEQFLP